MKYPHSSLLLTLTAGVIASVGASLASAQNALNRPPQKPVVITPPAINDGSNWSRAPMPAQRQFDDVKGPDGHAIDQLPPNTPATNTEPVVPPPRVAILQPTPAPSVGIGAEPGLLPTGRTAVSVSTGIDSAAMTQSLRASTMANREQLLNDMESRMTASDKIMSSVRSSASQMNADARRQFDTATADVKEKERALKKSIHNARKATDAEWMSSREQVAADYQAYAAALARVDAANGVAR